MGTISRRLKRQIRIRLREGGEGVRCYPSAAKQALWCLFICAALLFAKTALALYLPESEEFYPADEYGPQSYGYVDIALLSWEVAHKGSRESYYLVADEEHYIYLVQLTKKQFSDLEEVYEYTFSDSEEPVIKRIKGVPTKISEELYEVSLESFNQFTGLNADIDAYKDYVGVYFLDASSAPQKGLSSFLAAAFFVSICALGLPALSFLAAGAAEKRYNKELTMFDLERAESQLNASTVCAPTPILLLPSYLVAADRGIAVVPYSSIAWIYIWKNRKNPVLSIWNKSGCQIPVAAKTGEAQGLEQAVRRITEQNPDVLCGNTPEVRALYYERLKNGAYKWKDTPPDLLEEPFSKL